MLPEAGGGEHLDGGVPLAWAGGFPHAIVQNPSGRRGVLLRRHLHFGIFGLFKLCPLLSGALLPPADLEKEIKTHGNQKFISLFF